MKKNIQKTLGSAALLALLSAAQHNQAQLKLTN
jgi:hypothetical protein